MFGERTLSPSCAPSVDTVFTAGKLAGNSCPREEDDNGKVSLAVFEQKQFSYVLAACDFDGDRTKR